MSFTLNLPRGAVSTERPALIMGIVNCTPDSFFPGSRFSGARAVERALELVEEGADIIDLGGESTRPGAEYTDESEEAGRILPVIEGIRRRCGVPISVDTRRLSVFREAWRRGADILNDVSALEDDAALADFAAEKKCPVVLMHKRGNPVDMQSDTFYADILKEVDSYLRARVDFALSRGIPRDRIILDPGIGFGKDTRSNAMLIRGCGSLCGGEYPVLMALSRKTCVGYLSADADEEIPWPAERLPGSVSANLIAVQSGARILRVHDVKATRQMLNVLKNL